MPLGSKIQRALFNPHIVEPLSSTSPDGPSLPETAPSLALAHGFPSEFLASSSLPCSVIIPQFLKAHVVLLLSPFPSPPICCPSLFSSYLYSFWSSIIYFLQYAINFQNKNLPFRSVFWTPNLLIQISPLFLQGASIAEFKTFFHITTVHPGLYAET